MPAPTTGESVEGSGARGRHERGRSGPLRCTWGPHLEAELSIISSHAAGEGPRAAHNTIVGCWGWERVDRGPARPPPLHPSPARRPAAAASIARVQRKMAARPTPQPAVH